MASPPHRRVMEETLDQIAAIAMEAGVDPEVALMTIKRIAESALQAEWFRARAAKEV